MKMKIKHIILLLLGVYFSSCVDEYTIKGIDDISGILVIEGTITDELSKFKLSKSVGLNEEIKMIPPVQDAKVQIEDENGKSFNVSTNLSDPMNGVYVIENGRLADNLGYRLKVEYNGLSFYTDYLSPLNTPPIDSISFHKKATKEPIQVAVSTHDQQMQNRFYRWTYEEIWEIHADIFAEIGFDSFGNMINYDDQFNIYHCWGYGQSSNFLLGSSLKLNENKIDKKTLLEFPASDYRLSQLYYIRVNQNLVRKEAFDYYSNLQKNIENTGSIFAPIPSEMKGNIYCESDPELPVIGFIDVSRTSVIEVYSDEKIKNLYEKAGLPCKIVDSKPVDDPEDYILFSITLGNLYAPIRCLDCRYNGGSKKRPEFWPNDHY